MRTPNVQKPRCQRISLRGDATQSSPAIVGMGTPAPGCNGTVYNILKAGDGKEVGKGATVTVHATGVIKETGKKFWCARPCERRFLRA